MRPLVCILCASFLLFIPVVRSCCSFLLSSFLFVRSCCSFLLFVPVVRSCCSFLLFVPVVRSCCSFLLFVKVFRVRWSEANAFDEFDRWNPFVDLQAIGRVDRPGQKKKILAVRFDSGTSIEKVLRAMQADKKQLAGFAMDGEDMDAGITNIRTEEMGNLMSIFYALESSG